MTFLSYFLHIGKEDVDMSELRLCKEDFMQYRTLEVQEKFYKKQLAELRDKYRAGLSQRSGAYDQN